MVSKTNTNPCSYPVPADLREKERKAGKEKAEKEKARKEGRLENEAQMPC